MWKPLLTLPHPTLFPWPVSLQAFVTFGIPSMPAPGHCLSPGQLQHSLTWIPCLTACSFQASAVELSFQSTRWSSHFRASNSSIAFLSMRFRLKKQTNMAYKDVHFSILIPCILFQPYEISFISSTEPSSLNPNLGTHCLLYVKHFFAPQVSA